MKYRKLYMNEKNQQAYLDSAQKNYKKTSPLTAKVVEDGIILPAKPDPSYKPKLWAIGGVVDQYGHFIKESNSHYLFGGNYEYNEEHVNYSDEEVIFLGPFVKHWGHFICDEISRLWYILENPKQYKIAYCGWSMENGAGEITGNYLEVLKLLGIEKEQLINIQKPTQFKKIIIPDFSLVVGEYYTKEFEQLIDRIVQSLEWKPTKTPSKIYFTRSELANKDTKERGEKMLVDLLTANGYQVMIPEKLSVQEQIYYLNHARQIAMVSGSMAHNLMFCKQKTMVTIFNKIDLLNPYQMIIDHMTQAEITYVDTYQKILPVLLERGPFLLTFTKHDKRLCQERNWKIPKLERLKVPDYKWYWKQYRNLYQGSSDKKGFKQQTNALKERRQSKTRKKESC